MSQIIFHIDVNSAFLSWSAIKLLKNGYEQDIRTIPSIVGGDVQSRHGIVVAKSIPAKAYGIYTSMPVVSALKKCPNLLVIPPEHSYYQEMSYKLMDLLREFTPAIEQASVDECYMDYSTISNSYSSPEEAAHIIKDRVKKELGFTVNIGISDVKVLAKMASDFQKPDRVHTLYRREIKEKMWPLPVEDLFLAGKSSVAVLHKLGIKTIGDLANTPKNVLVSHLKSQGARLHEYAHGIDDSTVNVESEDLKGVGNSTTLPSDYDNIDEINKVFLYLSDKVSARLRYYGWSAKSLAIEIKFSDFSRITRQMILDKPTDSSLEIYEYSKQLFKQNWNGNPVRLLGIRTTKLVEDGEPVQLSLFDDNLSNGFGEDGKSEDKTKHKIMPSHDKLKKLDRAIDSIKEKYGDDKIKRAVFMEDKDEE